MQYPVGYVAKHVHQLYGLVQMPDVGARPSDCGASILVCARAVQRKCVLNPHIDKDFIYV
jgi:hypothetical protein